MLAAFRAAYIDLPPPIALGSGAFVSGTNPLGRPSVSSPASNVFGDQPLHDPFTLENPLTPKQ